MLKHNYRSPGNAVFVSFQGIIRNCSVWKLGYQKL